ncbi:hypothetical protein GOC82_28650 [Sinorhizobium medicae]|uniref:Uncharacterized protein n=2 Tax=Sinorhizobium medicae TaxID=110321 RepID=A0A508WUW7_9HYPH|nr:hypothetical protein [Sinorhizobium medicae]MDX0524807.1 hypothetical protein [Sinorhizobium medicae]VTZ59836.1 conserved exported hypothetical protein [Sinorhizobium medicae]
MLRSVLLAILLSVIPATAFANECPSIMAAIDAALPTATLAEPDLTKVKELRAAGDHAGSMAMLNQAKKMLGI